MQIKINPKEARRRKAVGGPRLSKSCFDSAAAGLAERAAATVHIVGGPPPGSERDSEPSDGAVPYAMEMAERGASIALINSPVIIQK